MRRQMRVLSLCTGIGGIDLACEATGAMEIVGQVELDEFCTSVLAYHWPHVQRMRDLMEVRGDEFGTVELVVAGFPCQPTSHAGKRRGTSDDRWLWPEVYRVIRCARPTWVLCENVPGLISLGLDDVLSDLDSAGYETTACVYPASAVGAPHERERIFIVAHANQHSGRWAERADYRDVDGATGTHASRERHPQRATIECGRADVADANSSGRRPNERNAQAGQSDAQGSGTLAHASNQRRERYPRTGWQEKRWAEYAGNSLADSNRQRQPQPSGRISQQRRRAGNQRQAVVYASGARCEERHTSRVACDTGHATGRLAEAGQRGQTESRVGVATHGLPGRLAGHPGWPARPGEAQYEWEAPRVVPANDRTPQRAAKLKALGNAVVPQQVLPILQAIAETWRLEGEAS